MEPDQNVPRNEVRRDHRQYRHRLHEDDAVPLVRGVVLVDGHDYDSFAVVEALMEAFFNASEARSARLLSPDSRGVVSVPMTRPFQLCVQPR